MANKCSIFIYYSNLKIQYVFAQLYLHYNKNFSPNVIYILIVFSLKSISICSCLISGPHALFSAYVQNYRLWNEFPSMVLSEHYNLRVQTSGTQTDRKRQANSLILQISKDGDIYSYLRSDGILCSFKRLFIKNDFEILWQNLTI